MRLQVLGPHRNFIYFTAVRPYDNREPGNASTSCRNTDNSTGWLICRCKG